MYPNTVISNSCNNSSFIVATQVKYAEKQLGIPRDKSARLYIYYSLTSFFSRHAVCKLADVKLVRTVRLYQVSVAAAGINFMFIPAAKSYEHLVGIFVVYGVFDGGSMVLFTLILLECVGQQRMNRAWGIFGAVQQIAAATGTPLAGTLSLYKLALGRTGGEGVCPSSESSKLGNSSTSRFTEKVPHVKVVGNLTKGGFCSFTSFSEKHFNQS